MYSKIQYISQGATALQQLDAVKNALDAGCTWVQLRFKDATEIEVLKLSSRVKKVIEGYACTYIINDYPHIAKEIGADGIHLGLDDMPVEKAREIIGPNKIIGGTANTLTHVMQRCKEQCDYIGLGPYRFTATKEKLSPVLGLQGYIDIMQHLKRHNVQMPIYAIGGILQDDIPAILHAGIYGVALSALITNHPHKKELLTNLNTLCSH
ncbi:thiamine phosphate synthase [Flavobacterium sp. RHBU_24]|uniref:thiamine phosphate synthase n=1 Tax=Flavobacterium sp. RHBU_24 TaxID=3391185 RepID=UPI0039853251